MKNGKLLFLLVLILCFTVFLVACDRDDEGSLAEEETTSVDQNAEQEEKKHEMLNYFILESEMKSFDCEPLAKYNGVIVASDETHNIVALKTQDLDVYNKVTDTVTLYNVLTGEALVSFDATYPLYVKDEQIELSVDIEYPVVRAVKKSYSEDGEKTEFEAAYYLIKKDAEALYTTQFYKSEDQINNDWVQHFGNGLVEVNMGDKVVWIDRDMETVRTVNAVAANGYNVDYFDSEYQGYLYAWDYETLQIFNREGICSGTYTMAHEGILNVQVLDDGNVLIQDFELVDIHTPCNVILGKERYVLTSLVMNCVNGTTEEKDLDFIVEALQTAYAQNCAVITMSEDEIYMPFKLCAGYDNQAIIYRINDAAQVSKNQEYVVLSNALEVQYTVKNNTAGIDFAYAQVVNARLYSAMVYEAGIYASYIFDLDGNKIAPSNFELYTTESYVFTDMAIYDRNMNQIYDIRGNGFELAGYYSPEMDAKNDKIYLEKHNFVTGMDEIYVFDAEAKAPVLFHDNKEEEFIGAFGGGYYTYDAETNNTRFYNLAGELKLSVIDMQGYYPTFMEDVLLVETTLDGKPVTFVVR